jgi:hypothetical protein
MSPYLEAYILFFGLMRHAPKYRAGDNRFLVSQYGGQVIDATPRPADFF